MQNIFLQQRQLLEAKYNKSRHNLLLVLLFTAVNLILLVSNANSYFLFSAYVPYFLVDLGMYFCGMYPAEVYGPDYSSMQFSSPVVFAVFLGIAIVILALYLLSWIFSKKGRVGWLIFAVVFFVIDLIALIYFLGLSTDHIVDIIFHFWVIVSLMMGIVSHFKLKKLPVEEIVISETEETVEDVVVTEETEQVEASDTVTEAEQTEVSEKTEEEIFH